MDTRKTHDGEVIIGQRWREKAYPTHISRTVKHITEKGIVLLDPSPKMTAYRRVHIDVLRRDWECVQGVELREYLQNHKRYAIQVFVNDGHEKYVYGQLKL